MTDTEQPVCSACFEPREHDDLDDDGLCSACREHSRICSKCRGLFDIASEGSEEDPAICYGCEEYLWCPSCGVELCKPSDCPDGSGFGCSSCGGEFVRKGSEMVPRARPVTLANQDGDFDPDAPNPGDTAALMRIRECIDKHGVWPNEQTEQNGDYELCVRFMAEQAAEHVGLAPHRTPVTRADLAGALGIADPISESIPGMLEKVAHHRERSIALDNAHEEIRRLKVDLEAALATDSAASTVARRIRRHAGRSCRRNGMT